MAGWLTTRESVKRSMSWLGSDRDQQIDELIAGATESIYQELNRDNDARRFIPYTALARLHRFPTEDIQPDTRLLLDGDLWSVDTLTKDGTDVVAIVAADYFLEPNNLGPPYHRIDIDLASTAFFAAKDTPQRAITVTGTWARSNVTATAGSLGAAIGTTGATSMQVKDGSLVEVGHTLLIQSEQLVVTERSDNDIGVNVAGSGLAASVTDTTLTLGDPADNLAVGEIIRINSEKMRVTSVNSATVVVVERQYDASTLAAHSSGDDIYAERTFTITRGENGTTAATHADDTAVSKYVVPADIRRLCRGDTIVTGQQERGGWAQTVGQGEGQTEFRGAAWSAFRTRTLESWRWR